MGKRSRSKRDQRAATAPVSAPAVVAPRPADSRTALIVAAALFVVTVATFSHVVRDNFITFDDPQYVTQNVHVVTGLTASNVAWALTSFYASNWHPLTWISHMIDVDLFGLDAGKHAMTSVVIHALSAVVLFFLLRRATRRLWPSAIVAALFALHPAHVESVAWIAERKDVLSALFFFITILMYVEWTARRTPARYALIVVALILGVAAKPMVVTLPFVLLLLDWWPLDRIGREKASVLVVEKLPLFVIAGVASLLTLHAQQRVIGATPLPERVGSAIAAYVAYIGKLIWPARLAILYPFRVVPAATVIGALVVLIAVTAAAVVFAKRLPFLPVGWFWYLGTLVPVIGIIQIGRQSMADRYTYIPSVGLFIAAVWLLDRLPVPRMALAGAAAVVVIALAVATFLQTRVWTDSITLFRHTIAVTEANDAAHVLLGTSYNAAGDPDAAAQEYRNAIAIDPANGEALNDLGRYEISRGRVAEAIPLLERSLAAHDDPATRAALESARGDAAGAMRDYERALAEHPERADLHNDLASLLARSGKENDALQHYEEALRLAPNQYDARMNLGALLSRIGRDHDALEQFRSAAALRPKSPEPHIYVALLSANEGRLDDAIAEVRAAAAIDPAAANQQLTNAIRIPFKETNLQEYLAFLQQRAGHRG